MRINLHGNAQRLTLDAQRSTRKCSLFTTHYSLFIGGGEVSRRRSRTVRGTVPADTSRAAFTVLELIMVIGVLSILLAIVLPTVKTVRASALRTRAKAEATALVQAAIRYKNEYGFWPGEVAPNNDALGTVHLDVSKGTMIPLIAYGKKSFLDNLTAKDRDKKDITDRIIKLQDDDTNGRQIYQAFSTVGHAASAPYPLNPLNPKGIRFLDLQNEGDRLRVDYRDPWNESYVLFMGMDPHALFTYQVDGPGGAFWQSVSNQIAFAFSFGSPERHGTNLIYSAGVGL